MAAAGLRARQIITVYRYNNEQSASGELLKVKNNVLTLHAYVHSQKGNTGEEGKELFDSRQIVFQIVQNLIIRDSDFITYQGRNYQITFIEQNIWDRTEKLYCSLLNE